MSPGQAMSRKLRPLTPTDVVSTPTGCAGCIFWESAGYADRRCGSMCDVEVQEAWFRNTIDEWGECGRAAYEDDRLLGFIKYAPSRYFPQAQTFAARPADPNVPLITCLHVMPEARNHGLGSVLLRSALSDMKKRGERRVESFGMAKRPDDFAEWPMVGVEFLERNGFTVVQPDAHFPLMQVELRSLVAWSDNLEAVLESLKLPLRIPERQPTPW